MTQSLPRSEISPSKTLFKALSIIAVAGLTFTTLVALLWLAETAGGASVRSSLSGLFAMNKVQAWWYVTRAAGLTGYLLIWLSMVWGLAVSSHILQPVLESAFAYDFHEFLSWAGLAFVGLHVTVLMLDKYLPFSLAQVLIPFLDSYRPLWVGLGVISSYVLLLVTVTFYLRKQLGSALFRGLHVLSLVGYVGATAHGLWAGTDSALGVTRILYAGSFLVVVFLTAHWLVLKWLSARERRAAEAKWQDRRRPRFQARSRP